MNQVPPTLPLLRSIAVLATALFPVASIGQSCQSPMTLVEYQIQAGTTCGYGTFLPYVDGYPFSQPQAIYKLTSNAALGGSIELQTSSFPGAVAVVMDGCQSGAHLLTPLFSAVEGQVGRCQIALLATTT
ncbi:MAG: hypothetical protein ABIP56_02385 [Dokdonella sp.]